MLNVLLLVLFCRSCYGFFNLIIIGRSVDKEKSNIYEPLINEQSATYKILQKPLHYPPTESLYSEPNAANTINSVSNGIYMYESVNANGQPPV